MIEIGKKGVLIQSQGGIDINSRDNKTEYEMKFGQVNQDAIPSRPYVPQYLRIGATVTWREPVLSVSLLPTVGNVINDVRVVENGGAPAIYICVAIMGPIATQWKEYVPVGASSHNLLFGLQGGTPGQYYHFTAGEYADKASMTWTTALVASVSGQINEHNELGGKQGGGVNEFYHLNASDYNDRTTKTYVDNTVALAVSGVDMSLVYTASANSYLQSQLYTNALVESTSGYMDTAYVEAASANAYASAVAYTNSATANLEHNDLQNIDGGTYHLSQAQYNDNATKTDVWGITNAASGEAFNQFVAQKGAANGVATLDAGLKIPSSQIPAMSITETFVVATTGDLLVIDAQIGDLGIVTSNSTSYILQTEPASSFSGWVQILTPPSAVTSVNNQVGNVNLTTTDIPQGTNEYFTNQKAINAVQSLVESASGNAYSAGVSYTNSATANLEHNDTKNIQGGAIGQYYHLNSSDYADRITKTEATSLSESASANAYNQSVEYTNTLVAATSGSADTALVYAASANAYNEAVLYTNTLVETTSGYTDTAYVESASASAYNQGVAYTNSATANLEHNNLQNIDGGTYHLAQLEYNQVRSAATGAVTGMLTPADWNTFNNKQDALSFTTETENKFLRDDNTFQPIETAVGGYANNLYFSDSESDVATYNTLTYTPPSGQTTHTHTVNSSEGNKLLHAYIYPSAVSVDIFPSGIWSFKFYGNADTTAGITQIGVEYFARHQDTSETTLFTDWSDEINNTSDGWFSFSTYTHPAYSISTTDRMGARVYVKTTHPNDVTLTYYVGDGYGAYINNPNKIRHSQLRGLNDDSSYLHVTSAEKTTWNGKAEVAYVESASANAYSAGVTYTNSASSWSYSQGTSYSNSASANAYAQGVTYSNSASAEAYGQSVVYSRQRWIDINRCGLLNQTETTISFDGTDTFTLGSVGATWSYYRAGIKYTITGPKSVVVATPMVDSTLYFIYIDSTDGSLTSSTSAWTLNDTKIPVATIFWDSTQTPQYHMAEERHTILIDRRMHYYEHFHTGTAAKSVGAVAGYVLNTDTNIAKTFAVSASSILDEDIIFNLASFPQPNGTTADYPVMYRTAASTWKWKQSNMPFVYNVGNTNNWIQYDVNGTMTDATGGGGGSTRWVNSYLCMTNMGSAYRYVIIPGRAQFTSLALAQAEDPSTFSFAGFPSGEFFIAYQLTWTTLTSGQTGQCRLAAIPKRVSVAAVQTSQTGVSVDHNTLAGLQGGAAGEYYHLSALQQSQAISAATATATGLLAAEDFATFNNKAGTVSPVFTGTVQAASIVVPTLNGGTAANDNITIQGTTDATRTTSYVNLQPNGGFVGIGTATPSTFITANGEMAFTGKTSASSNPTGLLIYGGTSGGTIYARGNASSGSNLKLISFDSILLNTLVGGSTDTTHMRIIQNGAIGIGVTSPTAVLHLKAGTATASTAPLKLTQASAVVLTTPEAGAIECNDGDALYYTIKTGPTRKTIAFLESPVFTGTVQASAVKISGGASENYVYTSDAVGVGRWAPPTGGGITWTAVTSDGNLAADTGTLANKSGTLFLTLPSTCAVGKVIEVAGMHATGYFTILQNAGQSIFFGNNQTTVGINGALSSTGFHDSVKLVCSVADTTFVVVSSIGTFSLE